MSTAPPGQLWFVSGGEDTGGILVRRGEDPGSSWERDRLSQGSFLRQARLVGDSLEYELVAGTGPPQGWVSLELNGRSLVERVGNVPDGEGQPAQAAKGGFSSALRSFAEIHGSLPRQPQEQNGKAEGEAPGRPEIFNVWEVVGGEDKGGILVRKEMELGSEKLPERLATGSIVRELELREERLSYQLLKGKGPALGCVSIRLNHKELVAPKGEGSSLDFPQTASQLPVAASSASSASSGAAGAGEPGGGREEPPTDQPAPSQPQPSEPDEAPKAKTSPLEPAVPPPEPSGGLEELAAAVHSEEELPQPQEEDATSPPQTPRTSECPSNVPAEQEASICDHDASSTAFATTEVPSSAVSSTEPGLRPHGLFPEGALWEVVGGEDKGGILVRTGLELASEKEDERLATGSFVWQLALVEERLHYRLLAGDGPETGWVSTRLYHKELLALRLSCTSMNMAEAWLEEEKERKAAERRARQAAETRAHMEMLQKAAREAERQKEAERRAKEMEEAQRKSQEQQAAQAAARRAAEEMRAREEQRRREEQHQAQKRPWDKHEVDKLELSRALEGRSSPRLAACIPDLPTLKRCLIRRLRLEEDEEQGTALDLPDAEDKLLGICDRVFDLEGLKDVVFGALGDSSAPQALGDILSLKITAVDKLMQMPEKSLPAGSVLHGANMEKVRAAASQRVMHFKLCELVDYGKRPFLVTAPHNAFLLRDGQPPHQLEQWTTGIAQGLAQSLEGQAMVWTRQVQWRTAYRFSLGVRWKRSGVPDAYSKALDAGLRDPNYMRVEEVQQSAWFLTMESWALAHIRGAAGTSLHVDVHGCQDPPMWPTHAILGLGAMRQHAEERAEDDPTRGLLLQRLHTFAALVEPAVAHALAPVLGVSPQEAASLRGLAAATTETGERAETLSGAWPPDTGRLTQTQQAVSHVGISHALQLELSLTLRRTLSRDPFAVSKLAHAIRSSWMKAISKESQGG